MLGDPGTEGGPRGLHYIVRGPRDRGRTQGPHYNARGPRGPGGVSSINSGEPENFPQYSEVDAEKISCVTVEVSNSAPAQHFTQT